MIDRREIFDHIPVESVAVPAHPGVTLIQRLVRALAHAAGKIRVDETRLPDRLDDLAQCVVHHPVAKRRRADQPPLGLADVETVIVAGAVGPIPQLVLQRQQIALHIELERGHRRPVALALAGGAKGPVEVLKVVDLGI
jgi:hypothetical protein